MCIEKFYIDMVCGIFADVIFIQCEENNINIKESLDIYFNSNAGHKYPKSYSYCYSPYYIVDSISKEIKKY